MPTISEYGRARGVSHQYISKLVKKGMPLSTFEAADLWREAHASSKPSTNPTRIARVIGEEHSRDSLSDTSEEPLRKEGINPAKHPSGSTLETAVMNARRAADEAWRLLHEAMIEGKASKIHVLLSIHSKAVDALFTAESACREELERRRILIPLAEAMDIARRGYEIILQRLNTLPQNVASQCNPADPSRAITALESECSAILRAAQEVYVLWSKGGPHITTAADAE
jgi:hypothetical protein